MAVAFATFDEAHAWLIRGLVEYGWPDLTPSGGRVPPGRHGGIELARFRDSGGRDGVHLLIPAAAGGQICDEDGIYDFTARIYDNGGQLMVAVRCSEANYLQEFPYDAGNPLHAAGYVHQAVTAYVPQFVQWRLGGGELSWAQRKGLPEIEGAPCSSSLTRFLDEMIRTRRALDAGPAEGWWIGKAGAPPPPSGHAPAGQAAPAAWGGGPIAVAGRAAGGGGSDTDQAEAKVKLPAKLLTGSSSVLLLIGLVSLLNALLTVALFFLDRPAALGSSACFGVALTAFGGIGILGARRLGDLKKSLLPWVAVGANLVLPLLLGAAALTVDLMCCAAVAPILLCLPVSIWALAVLVDPVVVKTRDQLAQAGRA